MVPTGYLLINDPEAISSLKLILAYSTEKEYFRGDALQAIYTINNELGEKLSDQYKEENNYLKMMYKAIKNKEEWVTHEPTGH